MKKYSIINKDRFYASIIMLIIILIISSALIVVNRSTERSINDIIVVNNTPYVEYVIEQISDITIKEPVEEIEIVEPINIEDLYYLAWCVEVEAGIEKYVGKQAVATVIINRAIHSNKNLFGGPTIKGVVLHQLREGDWQIDGVARANGKLKSEFIIGPHPDWESELSEDSVKAAKSVLIEGHRTYNPSVLYYYNPEISTDKRFIASVEKVGAVGRHLFARPKTNN
jgi:hypothetical protein